MLIFLIYMTTVGLTFGAAAVLGVVALARLIGGRLWLHLAAGLLITIGTIPPTVLGVLWYARTADYIWAIRGPGVFAHLGGGPTMLTAFILTGLWTAVCWTAALWLLIQAYRSVTSKKNG